MHVVDVPRDREAPLPREGSKLLGEHLQERIAGEEWGSQLIGVGIGVEERSFLGRKDEPLIARDVQPDRLRRSCPDERTAELDAQFEGLASVLVGDDLKEGRAGLEVRSAFFLAPARHVLGDVLDLVAAQLTRGREV